MKTWLWIGLGFVVVFALVVSGLAVGWAVWGRQLWAAGPFAMPGTLAGCSGWGSAAGPGMMGGRSVRGASCPAWGGQIGPDRSDSGVATPFGGLTIEEAHEAVERYAAALGYPNLEVAEVMEFERNFYAIVRETDTGIGAMELLVDKRTGAVGPEMGPNMMWNGRYGMHRRGGGMMGGASDALVIAPEEALEIAQRWLDSSRPGVVVEEHADPFYGYYTIHTLKDGQIEGMLSVHGTTGQVWYHTWHGHFVQMIGEEEDEH